MCALCRRERSPSPVCGRCTQHRADGPLAASQAAGVHGNRPDRLTTNVAAVCCSEL
jgi:hypothetical protein